MDLRPLIVIPWLMAAHGVDRAEDAEPSSTTVDLDGDGHAEQRTEWSSIGSGWKSWLTCVVDGASGHTSCFEWQNTAYATFSGWRRTGEVPAEGNLARRPRLHRVAAAESTEVWQQGHALALSRDGQHAWLVNLDLPADGFKVDRWDRIGEVAIVPGGVLVSVNSMGEPRSAVIALPAP